MIESSRGVHLQDFAYHGAWCEDKDTREWWLGLMADMKLGYVIIINDGDSVMEKFDGKPVLQHLLDRGINPIIRDNTSKLPTSFLAFDTVKATVALYKAYGLRPHWILWNEPGDSREWKNKEVPENWWDIFVDKWIDAAPKIVAAGANAGFPDGPGYNFRSDGYQHPFIATRQFSELWLAGLFWYAAHCYGKNRPWDYPYDEVTQTGKLYTQAEYDADLDEWAQIPGWKDTPPLELINAQRQDPKWMRPGATIHDDDTCWLSWRKVLFHAREVFGHNVRTAVTEGGWVPRDRPGSGNAIDIRWALTTPNMVAKKTLHVMQNSPELFAICPWLLASKLMGGSGWETDAWVTGAYRPIHWLLQPVVETLIATPVNPQPPDNRLKQAIALLTTGASNTMSARGIVQEAKNDNGGAMNKSLLTLHFQLALPPWFDKFVTSSGVSWVKAMDPGDQEPFAAEHPDLNWVIRFNEPENIATQEVLHRKQGAYERLIRLGPELRKRPWLSKPRFYLEHMNEPSNAYLLTSADKRMALDVFTAEFTRLLWEQYGIRSCGYCLGVGHPEPEHVMDIFKAGLPALKQYHGIWALHEYNYPTVLTYGPDGDLETHLTLRHRRTLKALADRGYPTKDLPDLHITEAGIDRLLTGIRGGWREIDNNPSKYVDQLSQYDRECQKQPLVKAIYIFTATAQQLWWTYEMQEADAEVLAGYTATGKLGE